MYMKRTITTAFLLLYTTVIMAVNGVSLSQRTIGNGLESQSLNVLAKDSQGRLWVGSDVGLSVISNGTVTNIRDVVSEGGLVMLGNVKSIVCHKEILIACDDRILCYNPKRQQATTLRYDDIILQTDDILLCGDEATFYDSDTHSLYSFDMEKHRCRLLATFTDQDYNFCRILKSSAASDSALIYLADDALGLFSYDLNKTTLTHIETDLPIVAKATAIDKSNIIWVSVPSKGIKGYYINSNYEQIAQYSTANCALQSNDISYITTLPNGNLLTALSDAGVCIGKAGPFCRFDTGKSAECLLVSGRQTETAHQLKIIHPLATQIVVCRAEHIRLRDLQPCIEADSQCRNGENCEKTA